MHACRVRGRLNDEERLGYDRAQLAAESREEMQGSYER